MIADYCDRLHRTVTQEQCASCWLRYEADPDLLLQGAKPVDNVTAARGGLWDDCRERHICEDSQSGQ